MKQLNISILLAVLMSMVGAKAFAYDIEVKNADGVTIYYNYTSDGLELEVTKGNSSYSGNVVIPDEVTYMNRTRKVTSIGNAFFGCTGLTSVTICNSVTSIGKRVFYGCSGLASVTIGNSVTSIGEKAFYKCSGLKSINIPNSVTSIGEEAFYYCNSLEKVIVKDIAAWCRIEFGSNPLIKAGHLYSDENTEITDLVIPNSVTSIGESAFSHCSGLKSVTIPNSVTRIGSDAFSGCNSLEKVIVKDIAAWCRIKFGSNPLSCAEHLYSDENTEITDLVIPSSVTWIDKYAFYNCKGLKSVTIGNSVTWIGKYAFYNCKGLKSVTIGNSVTWIGDYAFYDCDGLTSVTIPNSVTSIGSSAFSGCSGLTSVTIPNSVTSIGSSAFSGCKGLTAVTIGNSVTSIGEYAFDSDNLATVVSLIENPFKINSNVFSQNTLMNATLCVPTGTKDKYKATEGWKNFVFIEEGYDTDIRTIQIDATCKSSQYTLDGKKCVEGKKGLMLVRYSDGTVKKVIVK